MNDIKSLNDAELVEAVAREVLECNVTGDWGTSGKIICKTPPIGIQFDPFHDANDLQMVKDKFEYWEIRRDGNDNYRCAIFWDADEGVSVVTAHAEARAVLEAALEAKGEKG